MTRLALDPRTRESLSPRTNEAPYRADLVILGICGSDPTHRPTKTQPTQTHSPIPFRSRSMLDVKRTPQSSCQYPAREMIFQICVSPQPNQRFQKARPDFPRKIWTAFLYMGSFLATQPVLLRGRGQRAARRLHLLAAHEVSGGRAPCLVVVVVVVVVVEIRSGPP